MNGVNEATSKVFITDYDPLINELSFAPDTFGFTRLTSSKLFGRSSATLMS